MASPVCDICRAARIWALYALRKEVDSLKAQVRTLKAAGGNKRILQRCHGHGDGGDGGASIQSGTGACDAGGRRKAVAASMDNHDKHHQFQWCRH